MSVTVVGGTIEVLRLSQLGHGGFAFAMEMNSFFLFGTVRCGEAGRGWGWLESCVCDSFGGD